VNRLPRLAIGLLALASACSDPTDTPMEAAGDPAGAVGRGRVFSSADAGPGSFRQAILDATADPSIGTILFQSGHGSIHLLTPVTWSGAQSLVVRGAGTRLDGSGLGGRRVGLRRRRRW
jgi:hypothetical protein